MTKFNPGPFRDGDTFVPLHRMTAVLRGEADVRAAVADSRALGIADGEAQQAVPSGRPAEHAAEDQPSHGLMGMARGGWSRGRVLGQTAASAEDAEVSSADIDEALAHSFPASDPPAFNTGIARVRPTPQT